MAASFTGSAWLNYALAYDDDIDWPIARVQAQNLSGEEVAIVAAELVRLDDGVGGNISLVVDSFAGATPGTARRVFLPSKLITDGMFTSTTIEGLYKLEVRISIGGEARRVTIGGISTVSIASDITVTATIVNPSAWNEGLNDSDIKGDLDTYGVTSTLNSVNVRTYKALTPSYYEPYHKDSAAVADEQGYMVARLQISGGQPPYNVAVYEADTDTNSISVSADMDSKDDDDVSTVFLYIKHDVDPTEDHAVKFTVSDSSAGARILKYSFNHALVRTPVATISNPDEATNPEFESGDYRGFEWKSADLFPKRLSLTTTDGAENAFAYSTDSSTVPSSQQGVDGTGLRYIEFGFLGTGADPVSGIAYTIAPADVTYTENGYVFKLLQDAQSFFVFKPVQDIAVSIVESSDNIASYNDAGVDILATTVEHTSLAKLLVQWTGGFGALNVAGVANDYMDISSVPYQAYVDSTAGRTVQLDLSNFDADQITALSEDATHENPSVRFALSAELTAVSGAKEVTGGAQASSNQFEVYRNLVSYDVFPTNPYAAGTPLFKLIDNIVDGTTIFDLGKLADGGAAGFDGTAIGYTLATNEANFKVVGDVLQSAVAVTTETFSQTTLQISDAVGNEAFTDVKPLAISYFTKPVIARPSESVSLRREDLADMSAAVYEWTIATFSYSGGYLLASGGTLQRPEVNASAFSALKPLDTINAIYNENNTVTIRVDKEHFEGTSPLWGNQATLTVSFPAVTVDQQQLWAEGGSTQMTITFVSAEWSLKTTANVLGGVDADGNGFAMGTSKDALLLTNHANEDMTDYALFEASSLFKYGDEDQVLKVITEFLLELESLGSDIGYKIAVIGVQDGTVDGEAGTYNVWSGDSSVATRDITFDNIDELDNGGTVNYYDDSFEFIDMSDPANPTSLGSIINASDNANGKTLRLQFKQASDVPVQGTKYLMALVSGQAGITAGSGAFQRRILINRFDDLQTGATLTAITTSTSYLDRLALSLGTPADDNTGYDFVDIDYTLQGSTKIFGVTADAPVAAGEFSGKQSVTLDTTAHGLAVDDAITLYAADDTTVDTTVLDVASDVVTVDVLTGDFPAGTSKVIVWANLITEATAEQTSTKSAVETINDSVIDVLPERYEDGDDGTSLNSNLHLSLNPIHYRLLMRNAIGQTAYVSSDVFSGRDLKLNSSAEKDDVHQPLGSFRRESLSDDGRTLARLSIQKFLFGDVTVYGFTSDPIVIESDLVAEAADIPSGTIG